MATTTLSNEEILEAIGNKTVVELADLIEHGWGYGYRGFRGHGCHGGYRHC